MTATIPHGTSSGYGYHKCRCDACRGWVRESSRARRERQRRAQEAAVQAAEKQALDEALGLLHEPPGGCGWHVIRCRHCRWIAKYRTRQQQQIAGFLHARSHVNEILLKEYT